MDGRHTKKQSVFMLLMGISLMAMFYSVYNSNQNKVSLFDSSPNIYTNSIEDWKNVEVSTLSAQQIIDYFYWTNASSCRLSHYFGGLQMNQSEVRRITGETHYEKLIRNLGTVPLGVDGQYAVCIDPPTVSPFHKIDDRRCIVYSFGINNEWSFDDAMAGMGCQVFAFDPSMDKDDFDRSEKIHFYDLALAKSDGDGRSKDRKLSTIYKTLEENHKDHGKDAIIDYLKIDIEHNEWPLLPEIVESGILNRVRQLALEIHLFTDMSLSFYRNSVGVLKSLEDAGMVRFDSKYCPWCPDYFPALNHTGYSCFQIVWYNSRFIS